MTKEKSCELPCFHYDQKILIAVIAAIVVVNFVKFLLAVLLKIRIKKLPAEIAQIANMYTETFWTCTGACTVLSRPPTCTAPPTYLYCPAHLPGLPRPLRILRIFWDSRRGPTPPAWGSCPALGTGPQIGSLLSARIQARLWVKRQIGKSRAWIENENR